MPDLRNPARRLPMAEQPKRAKPSMAGRRSRMSIRPGADRHSEDAPKMVDFRDPARIVLTAYEHRKRGKTPLTSPQG